MDQITTPSLLQIGSTIVQTLSLVFLVIYVIKTWEMASATRRAADATEKSVSELKEARDQESAPYVVVYFDIPPQSNLIYLVVKNIGHSVAENIRLTFSPTLQSDLMSPISELSFIKDGIKSMPPEYEIRTIVDATSSYFGNSSFPLQYNVRVSYFGGVKKTERIYEQTLDLSAQKGLAFIREKGLNNLVVSVENIYRELQSMRRTTDNVASLLNEGIFINNPALTITTIEPYMSKWKEALLAKLCEFKFIWLLDCKDELLEPGYPDRIIRYAKSIRSQLLLLLANSTTPIKKDLLECLSTLSENLQQLGEMHFYGDGGESIKAFNVYGEKIIEQIDNAFALIEKESEQGHTTDVVNPPPSPNS